MKEDIYNYLERFDEQTKQRFCMLYRLIYECTSQNIDEKLWAKLPSFYVDNNVVRLILFKDHVNIEAKVVIFHNQQIPCELLKVIFEESFV